MLRTYHDYSRHSWILGMDAFAMIRSYSPDAAATLADAIGDLGPRVVLDHASLPYEVFFDMVPPEHMKFLASLRTFLRMPEAVCVHGGLDPTGGRAEEQEVEHLLWGADGFPAQYGGDDRIVYGHAANPVFDGEGWPRPRILGRTYGLDTIGQGVLTALRLPDAAVERLSR
jgi:diadenosine tetraphosphatase ApaH/serine/threonine PP2A family protein phosphatase